MSGLFLLLYWGLSSSGRLEGATSMRICLLSAGFVGSLIFNGSEGGVEGGGEIGELRWLRWLITRFRRWS